MKKTSLPFCLFILLVPFTSSSQVQYIYNNNTFDFFTSFYGRSSEILMTDNSLPATNSDIIFVSADLNLGINFVKSYSGSATDDSESVMGTADGGALITGHTSSFGSVQTDALVIKTDAGGNLLWAKRYGDIRTDKFKKGIELADNNLAFAGQSNKFLASQDNAFFVKTDSNGDTLFTRYFSTPSGFSIINDMVQSTNGDLILAGTADTGGVNSTGHLLMRLDQNGNILWTRVFNNPGYEGCWAVKEDNNGNIYASGYTNANSVYECIVIKCDATGNLLWAKKYSRFTYAYDIAFADDNKIILSGYGPNILTSSSHAVSMAIDSMGNVLWSKRYGGTRQSNFYTTLYHQGALYFGGTLSVSPGDDALAVKTDTAGNSGICYEEFQNVIDSAWNFSVTYTDPWNAILTGTNYFPVSPNVSTPVFVPTSLQNMTLTFNTQYVYADGNCNGSATVNPVNGTAPYVFSWSNFQNSQTISNLCAGGYSVSVQDDFGCIVSDSVFIITISPENPICLVSVDSTSTRNVIVWEKPSHGFLDSFRVYRDIVGNYTLVGSIPFDSLSRFADTTMGVNPNVTSYRYKITTVDSAGNESVLSAFHKTLHLTTNIGGSGERNLIWDGYLGFGFGYYYRILRDTLNNGTYAVLDSVSNTNFTYTDWTAPAGDTVNYLIEIVYPGGCTATRAENHNSTRSNRSQSGVSGGNSTGDMENNFGFSVFPNPADESIYLFSAWFDQYPVTTKIISADGRIVFSKNHSERARNKRIDVSSLSPGIYFVTVAIGNTIRTEKLVIAR